MYVKKEGISVNVCAGIGAVGGSIGGLAFDFVVQTFAGMLDHNYHYSLNMYSSLAFGGLGTVAGAVAGTTAGVAYNTYVDECNMRNYVHDCMDQQAELQQHSGIEINQ